MFSIFGKKKNIEVENPIVVIQNMKTTLGMLEKREKFLEKNIDGFKQEAKILVQTNKSKAIMLLKKAKMNEKQLFSIYGQKENLETQIFIIEQGITNNNIISSMREGKNVIEKMSKNLDPENVGELMDGIAETLNIAKEISDTISIPIGEIYDDDELLKEFEDNTLNLETIKIPSLKHVDNATHVKNIKKKTEEEELQELMLV
jgi:charged multivesicular body protein 6